MKPSATKDFQLPVISAASGGPRSSPRPSPHPSPARSPLPLKKILKTDRSQTDESDLRASVARDRFRKVAFKVWKQIVSENREDLVSTQRTMSPIPENQTGGPGPGFRRRSTTLSGYTTRPDTDSSKGGRSLPRVPTMDSKGTPETGSTSQGLAETDTAALSWRRSANKPSPRRASIHTSSVTTQPISMEETGSPTNRSPTKTVLPSIVGLMLYKKMYMSQLTATTPTRPSESEEATSEERRPDQTNIPLEGDERIEVNRNRLFSVLSPEARRAMLEEYEDLADLESGASSPGYELTSDGAEVNVNRDDSTETDEDLGIKLEKVLDRLDSQRLAAGLPVTSPKLHKGATSSPH